MGACFLRYAIYFLPPAGALADFGAAWLGWDIAKATAVARQTNTGPGMIPPHVIARPRRYGFHATLKPPFHLAQGTSDTALVAAINRIAATTPPACCEGGLLLSTFGNFLALIPRGDADAIARLAAACVTGLHHHVAPPTGAELARRHRAAPRLTPRQKALLNRWHYPYVLDEYRFHMTLSGPLAPAALKRVATRLTQELPPLPRPFVINEIALVGERADGMFQSIRRFRLAGGCLAPPHALTCAPGTG